MDALAGSAGALGEPASPSATELAAVDGTLDVGRAVEDSCREWLESLSADQRRAAMFAPPGQSEDERLRWFFTPTDHGGLALTVQQPHQQRLMMKTVSSALSEAGYVTVATLMGLENVLDRLEGWTTNLGRDRGRDPGMYSMSVFGQPGASMWGWRLGGHHISVNQLMDQRRVVATTPLFLGADPAAAPLIGGTLRPLAGIQDVAFDVVRSLDKGQFEQALIHPRAVPDIVGGNRARLRVGDTRLRAPDLYRGPMRNPSDARIIETVEASLQADSGFTAADEAQVALTSSPLGIAAADLSHEQRAAFRSLLEHYFASVAGPVANVYRARYHSDEAVAALGFAWAGGRGEGLPHYYRVQGPGLFIEYSNFQRGANHAHSVWRDPHADFGGDLLRHHLAAHPHQ